MADGDTHLHTLVVSSGLEYGDASSSVVVFGAVYEGSATWDAASIATAEEEAKEVTVTGAALGDFCLVSLSIDVADLVLNAQVTAANTVTCVLANNTGGAINLDSATVYVRVFSRT